MLVHNIVKQVMGLVMVTSFGLGSLQGEELYQILFHRHSKVGSKQEVEMKLSIKDETDVLSEGVALNSTKTETKVKMVASIEVLGLDKLKRGNKIRIVIDDFSFETSTDSEVQHPFSKGAEILIEFEDGKTVMSQGGNRISGNQQSMLGLLIQLPTAEIDHDMVFGTDEKKKVGDSWPVNAEMSAKLYQSQGLSVDPKSIKGKVTFEKLQVFDKEECLVLDVKVDISHIPVPEGLGKMDVSKSTYSVAFQTPFPINVEKFPRRHEVETQMQLEATMPNPANRDAPELLLTKLQTRNISYRVLSSEK